MAIYHFSAQTVNRTAGRSATAAAAYRAGEEIVDERQGLIHDYTRKGGVLHTEIMTPPNAPAWASDRASLWNAVERAEKRKDAQVAREIVVALPHELNEVQRIELLRGFVKEHFIDLGMIADVAFHAPDSKGDMRNFHAHVMLTMRDISPDGFSDKKNRTWNDKELLNTWREQWAAHANTALEAAGSDARIDHRTLEAQHIEALENGDLEAAQELDRAPQIHNGPRVTQILREAEKEGRAPLGALDRAAANDSIGFDLDRGKAELAVVISMIEHIEKRAAERETAHAEANYENDLRDRLTAAKTELIAIESQRIDLAIKLDQGEPGFVQDARDMRKEMLKAKAAAQAYRKENPWLSKAADFAGFTLEADLVAEKATSRFVKSQERRQAKAWSSERKEDAAKYKNLCKQESACKDKVSRLNNEIKALNRPDPELIEKIENEVALAKEHFRPAIQNFVSDHKEMIGGIASGADAWVSTDIATGDPFLDKFIRKLANLRSRMIREELQRVKSQAEIPTHSMEKVERSFRKTFDSAYAAESLKVTSEAATKAARAPRKGEYIPTLKRRLGDGPGFGR